MNFIFFEWEECIMFVLVFQDQDGKYVSLEEKDKYCQRIGGETRNLSIHRHRM